MDDASVSVIMPVYNGAEYIAEGVDSIQRQSRSPLEIIIVDDGSTEDTAGIVAGITGPVRYVYQPNSGPASARNRGIGMARGRVIGFLDVDDLWPENHVEILAGDLVSREDVDIVMGRVQLLVPSGTKDGKRVFTNFADPAVTLSLGSALFRKSVFDKAGLLDPKLRFSEDADWFLRARECGVSMRVLDEVTLFYRRHGSNSTSNMLGNDLNFVRALKRSLDRRRSGNDGHPRAVPRFSDFRVNKADTPDGEDRRKGDAADR